MFHCLFINPFVSTGRGKHAGLRQTAQADDRASPAAKTYAERRNCMPAPVLAASAGLTVYQPPTYVDAAD
jgi:hypothetical protein